MRESKSKGLKENVSKTQVMVVSKIDTQVPGNIVINDQRLKKVRNFKYHDSTISGRSDCDKNARVAIVKTASNKVKPLMTNRRIL